jgi:hypothetical protein
MTEPLMIRLTVRISLHTMSVGFATQLSYPPQAWQVGLRYRYSVTLATKVLPPSARRPSPRMARQAAASPDDGMAAPPAGLAAGGGGELKMRTLSQADRERLDSIRRGMGPEDWGLLVRAITTEVTARNFVAYSRRGAPECSGCPVAKRVA